MATQEAIQSNQGIIQKYQQEINQLRDENAQSIHFPDEFLLRCLFSRNMDVIRASLLVSNAVRLHEDYNIMLDMKRLNMDVLGVSLGYVSRAKTLEGHHIIYNDIEKWNPRKVSYYDSNYNLTLLQGAVGWNDLAAAKAGIVVITDALVVNLHHIKEVTFSHKSTSISSTALTNYLPYNNKYNLVINASYGANICWKGASLVMPKQMVESMHFIRKGDKQTLAKYFSKEVIENELYKPTQADLEWSQQLATRYANYRNKLYQDIIKNLDRKDV